MFFYGVEVFIIVKEWDLVLDRNGCLRSVIDRQLFCFAEGNIH